MIEALEAGQGDVAHHLHHPASASSRASSTSDGASADWELVSGDDNNCSDGDSCIEEADQAFGDVPASSESLTMRL